MQSIKTSRKITPVSVLSNPYLVCSMREISLMIYRTKPVFSAPSAEEVMKAISDVTEIQTKLAE